LGRWEGIGQDLVNHCVNDILVQNARPLFFLDYIAAPKLDPQAVASVVRGMAAACRAAGCALIGGETAEMPGVYAEGAFDVAGAVVGLVDRAALLPHTDAMAAGDILVGLPSSGPHTNGYSLIRRAIEGQDLRQVLPDGQTLADALLAPHRCYLREVAAIQAAGYGIKGMAHITGGGFVENVPRVLPPHLAARLVTKSWNIPPVFQQLMRWSGIERTEAYRVFNLGIGMVLIMDSSCAEPLLELLPEANIIGRLIARAEDAGAVQIIFPEKL
jgi:phosphoribosylformylglycinamidine cyclo-ligase